MRLALVVAVLALGTTSVAPAQGRIRVERSTVAYPAEAELERYPITWTKDPTQSEVKRTMSALGLRLDTLKTAWTGFNWYRRPGRFVLETIPAGTPVYVDAAGTPRYRADCGNRLIELVKCPFCGTRFGNWNEDSLRAHGLVGNGSVQPARSSLDSLANTNAQKKKGFWSSLNDGMKALAMGLLGGIGSAFGPLWWLIVLLATIAIVLLVLWLLWRLLRDLLRNRGAPGSASGSTPAPVPATPPPGGSGGMPSRPTLVPTTPPAAPAATPPAPTPRPFLRIDSATGPGQDSTLRYSGLGFVRVEHAENGETVVRFRHS